jgi:hypothetical protein
MLFLQAIDSGSLELLASIMSDPSFRDFYLVGGTGLALQCGHRRSDDLDLFCRHSFEPLQLLPLVEKYGDVNVTGEEKNTLNCFVNGIKLDFIGYPYPLIADLNITDNIRIAGIPDIAAMKLSAIAQRGSKKDFFDLFELLNRYDLSALLGFFKLKYPTIDSFHIFRSLTYFEDAEIEKEPKVLKAITWEQVKDKISASVKNLENESG